MFDNIFAAIEKWMRELLSGMVESNLSTMFTAVNQQTSEIAAQVGQTPQGWNSSIFSMIRNISDSVVIPIAGIIITLIKDEEVAPYLSEAFSRYASGQKMRDIAKWLNEQGVEPPMRHKKRILGKSYDAESDQWTTDMLRCLFRNPTYTGAAAKGSRQIIAENCHEPYITKEQFYAFPCNMREGENKISIRKSYKKPNPLAKHIVCTCGYALCWHKDKKTEEELFYCRHCRAHKENGKNLKVPAATIYKKMIPPRRVISAVRCR